MIVSVIGLGYVGLPTAVLLANAGKQVFGVDINVELLDNIQNGKHQIEDTELNEMLTKVVKEKQLITGTQVVESDVFIIAVPTPVKDRKIDLRYVEIACDNICNVLKHGDLVILESTVAPGTTLGNVKPILESTGLKAGEDFSLSHIPERVQPGRLKEELTGNSRIIGGFDERSTALSKKVYASFVDAELFETDIVTAETVKVMENTYRDINIALANEFLLICEKLNVDPSEAIKLANQHPRIHILNPGPGVGGHCIPVDPWFLVEKAPEEAKLVKLARERNDYMPIKVTEDIVEILKAIKGSRVSLLGCTYKENTSDDRESPARSIVEELTAKGITYQLFDPHVKKPWNHFARSLLTCIENTDVMVLLVPHNEFVGINPMELINQTECRVIFDCTGKLQKEEWEKAGFRLLRLGNVKQSLM